MKIQSFTLLCVIIAVLVGSVTTHVIAIPPHPNKIEFPALEFEPPDASDFRQTLPNGVAVYLAPSSEFPLINISMTFRGGSYLDPENQIGLAAATGEMIRRGGTISMSAQELDEELDFLAAQISTSCGDTFSYASLNCLTSNLDESMSIFVEMLTQPGFQEDRLDVYKDEVIEYMKQRNDHAQGILSREWSGLMYGRNHFEAALSTQASINSISDDDLRSMHQRIFHPTPGHLVVAVTGDFEKEDMLSRLAHAFEGWETSAVVPDPPAPIATFAPGVYHVEKDIPQGKVFIGMRGIARDNPDYIPVLVMNHILGGGGFTSRITNRVRSDEGLAYSAGCVFTPKVYYPGEYVAFFQSKNRTVAFATKLVFEEINKILNELVSGEELATSQNNFIETFPRTFESKAGMLEVFVNDELTNRPKDYWKTYRDKVRSVTADDVQRVAKKYLVPKNMVIAVVGKWEEIAPGDLEGRASMSEFFGGNVTHLPLRDPLTLEEIK